MFVNEDDFEDLQIQDFVVMGRQTARRRLDRLTMPRGQSSVLERGSIPLGRDEVRDASHWGQRGTYPGDTLRIH